MTCGGNASRGVIQARKDFKQGMHKECGADTILETLAIF